MTLKEFSSKHSCGNSCIFGPPGGMGTNGTCNCVDHRGMTLKDAIELRRKIQELMKVKKEEE